MTALVAQASSSVDSIGGKLNQITGYSEIEDLKRQVREKGALAYCSQQRQSLMRDLVEQHIAQLRTVARSAKRAFEDAVSHRSSCQREINDLLQRKSNWSETDVSRFTVLVREDHLNEQAEQKAKLDSAKAEEDVERGQTELMQTILHRYHEEQVWSDKIRSASTYGSLLALGLNLFVFVIAIVAVEPWKRRRLAQQFETRVQVMEKENQELVEGGLARLQKSLDAYEATISRIAAEVMPPGSKPLPRMDSILAVPLPGVDNDDLDAAIEADVPSEPVDWRATLFNAWNKVRKGDLLDNSMAMAGVGGAVLGAVATGAVTLIVWSIRKQ